MVNGSKLLWLHPPSCFRNNIPQFSSPIKKNTSCCPHPFQFQIEIKIIYWEWKWVKNWPWKMSLNRTFCERGEEGVNNFMFLIHLFTIPCKIFLDNKLHMIEKNLICYVFVYMDCILQAMADHWTLTWLVTTSSWLHLTSVFFLLLHASKSSRK